MHERPIIFSGPMVNAILEGRKSQTRRVIKGMGEYINQSLIDTKDMRTSYFFKAKDGHGHDKLKCPYGEVGTRLWVREACKMARDHNFKWDETRKVRYRADNADDTNLPAAYPHKWTPAIHMPRWASRILLEVVSVRVERLNEISPTDCICEGIEQFSQLCGLPTYKIGNTLQYTEITAFRTLWESINGPASWDENPWVWVVEFRRVV